MQSEQRIITYGSIISISLFENPTMYICSNGHIKKTVMLYEFNKISGHEQSHSYQNLGRSQNLQQGINSHHR